ncbi:hypothetical protein [Clostridium psychrophilum]|uniref:hypothetical protein n=1 Tax=Clostridium psychrophilum TaxID=132926 RepID=UPI001C0CC66F|nr:hypothetical protein [Clostridium psychrophilum]MBU3181379.1 hypothetical protein [Clostridium psychrophilum]
MAERLNAKLKYLYEMLEKYNDLNEKNKDIYRWRQNSIQEQIEALEELLNDEPNNCWDECYEEDLREVKGRR